MLIASWRLGWTILVWLFIFVLIALLFKCLKSFLQSLGDTIEQLFNDQSHPESRARGTTQSRRNNTSVGPTGSNQSTSNPSTYPIDQRLPPTVPSDYHQPAPILNLPPNTPDLPPDYDQLSYHGSLDRGIYYHKSSKVFVALKLSFQCL